MSKDFREESPASGLLNTKLSTGLMLGRFQPWHKGHRTLFEQVLAKVGQVCIAVRDTQGTSEKDPFDFETVQANIRKDLDPEYAGKYVIVQLPNITGIYYGRDVGYTVEKLKLPDEIEAISATAIRKAMQNE
jgi:cytidyltransferase-like protein